MLLWNSAMPPALCLNMIRCPCDCNMIAARVGDRVAPKCLPQIGSVNRVCCVELNRRSHTFPLVVAMPWPMHTVYDTTGEADT